MKNKTKIWMYCAIAVALNVVLGEFVAFLHIPLLFLDTLGTLLISISFGIPFGIFTGITTNLIMGIFSGVTAVPFALVNIAVAIVAGSMAKGGYTLKKAIITGILLAIICPLIGTPIRLLLFGGFTGSGTDILILTLKATGHELATSTFIGAIAANIVDKIVSCLLIYAILQNKQIKAKFFSVQKTH